MSAQEWQIDGPKVLDIGDENERVTKLEVGVVGGRVDVVTHNDSPTARVEVTSVEGLPVRVKWDGGTLRVIHGKDDDKNIMDMLKGTFETFGKNRVVLSISVPYDARATVSSVSAAAVVSGLQNTVKVNSVSGAITVNDLRGGIDLNTVSGDIEGDALTGPTSVNTVSGPVTLQASDLPEVKVNTVSGDITLDLVSGKSRIKSNSVSGDVTVRAPFSGFDVEGNTASGQVVVDGRQLTRGGGGHGKHDRGGRLREGDGAMEIKANAVSGSIVVLRSSSVDSQAYPQDRPVTRPAEPATGSATDPTPFAPPTEQIPRGDTGEMPQDLPTDISLGEHPSDGTDTGWAAR